MVAKKILIVDDEASIRVPLASYLAGMGFATSEAANAAVARTAIEGTRYDLVVLDVMMPGEDGLSLCRHIRATSDLPVIMLTARSEDADRIHGLEIGADDFVSKPFNPRELLARINAVLRRTSRIETEQASNAVYQFGEWRLETHTRTLKNDCGVATDLSTGEFNLLVEFLRRPQTVLKRSRLLSLSRGREAAFDRSVDNMISRLRRKIEPDPKNPIFIKTVWGGGYLFSVDVKVTH